MTRGSFPSFFGLESWSSPWSQQPTQASLRRIKTPRGFPPPSGPHVHNAWRSCMTVDQEIAGFRQRSGNSTLNQIVTSWAKLVARTTGPRLVSKSELFRLKLYKRGAEREACSGHNRQSSLKLLNTKHQSFPIFENTFFFVLFEGH